MRGRRFISRGSDSALIDRVTSYRLARYMLPILFVALPGVLILLADPRGVKQLYLFTLFVGVLLSAILGGFGPGCIAIVCSAAIIEFTPGRVGQSIQLWPIIAQGILLMVVGATLRRARGRARQQLADNLRLEQQILEISDDERRRIGSDLHDGLGQHLTGIALLTESMSQQIQSGRPPDVGNVETISRLVSEAVGITRDLAKSLSPVTLEHEGLVAALEELAETSAALLGIECDFASIDPQGLINHVERTRCLHLFRIAQEAVNNSVRHGKAKHVTIRLSTSQRLATLVVTDDGSGLSSKTISRPGLGLRIMQYRTRMLQAALSVERASSAGGTIVQCDCPIDSENGATLVGSSAIRDGVQRQQQQQQLSVKAPTAGPSPTPPEAAITGG